LNPRICRVVALGTPTERERGQWYFQRYVAQSFRHKNLPESFPIRRESRKRAFAKTS